MEEGKGDHFFGHVDRLVEDNCNHVEVVLEEVFDNYHIDFFLLTVIVLSLKLSLTATMLKLSLTTDNKLVIIVLDDHQTVINDYFVEAIVTIFMSIKITSVDIVHFGIY